MHCSDALRAWVGKLTEADREKLRTWGIPSKLLKATDVEVSQHLLCAARRFWKAAHHVFHFDRTELTPTLEEGRRICSFSKIMGPLVFMRRDGYTAVLSQLTGLSAKGCQQRLICTSGPTPLLRPAYFDAVMERRAELGDELWLQGFVTRFLGKLIFTRDRMTVAIKIAKIALAVVTRQIDLAPVVLAETHRRLHRITHRCRHFHGCGALIQIWLAGHLEMDILRPQRHAFETYCNSGHARTIRSVHEEYEKLSKLTDDAVTWRIIPTAVKPFTIFFSTCDMRLVVLPGFTRGVEYHPIQVMRQFGFQQGAFVDSTVPRLLQPYPLSSTTATTELANLMRHGVQSTDIAAAKGSGCTPEYMTEVQGLWPINEIPPGAPLFPDNERSKKPWTS